MMKMQTYKVNFQPVGTFYFGNERTLGPDNADYFASSNYLPQQTTILGVIRYRLLEMRGWLKDHNGYTAGKKDDIDALIGPKSFCGNPPEKSSEFGVLKSLSPLFIEQDGVLLLPGALNRHYYLKSLSGQETSSTQGLWTSL